MQSQHIQFAGVNKDVVTGRNVVVVDTVMDSCRTMLLVLQELSRMGPESLAMTVLVDKRSSRRDPELLRQVGSLLTHRCHLGYRLNMDGFVVGYGLDYHGFFRNAPDIISLSSIPTKKMMVDSYVQRREMLYGKRDADTSAVPKVQSADESH
jgi:hypoxanthine-guanine phosphoribosyltransferase